MCVCVLFVSRLNSILNNKNFFRLFGWFLECQSSGKHWCCWRATLWTGTSSDWNILIENLTFYSMRVPLILIYDSVSHNYLPSGFQITDMAYFFMIFVVVAVVVVGLVIFLNSLLSFPSTKFLKKKWNCLNWEETRLNRKKREKKIGGKHAKTMKRTCAYKFEFK